MTMLIFGVIGFAAVTLLFIARSHRIMQAISVMHSMSYLLLAAYTFSHIDLPVNYFGGGYFFLDHLGVFEVMVASLIFMMAGIYAGGYVESLIKDGELRRDNLKVFYLSFNILLITTVLSFFSNNIALFWMFAELTTVFSALLIAILNSRKNIEASLRYIFITSTCMLFTFIGLIFLFTVTKYEFGEGTLTWTVLMDNAGRLPSNLITPVFILIFIGLAAKSGISPFHMWLPHAHAKAPSAVSGILSGALLNVGIYGILRMYSIVNQTGSADQAGKILVFFGVLSVGVAAFTMLKQKNLKKLIAFSSIEHMGLVLIGIGLGTPVAVFWVLYHTLAHAITKTLLFFSAGVLHRQFHSNKAEDMKDVMKLQPLASAGLILGGAAIIGVPPSPVFISKLFIMLQIGSASVSLLFTVLALVLIASVALGIYMLRLFSRVSEHEPGAHAKSYGVPVGMKASILALLLMVLLFGVFFPDGLWNLLNDAVSDLRL